MTGLSFPAKPRVTHSAVKELDKRFPGGFFEPTPEHGFDLYLQALDELSATGANSLRDWRAKADAKLGRNKVYPITHTNTGTAAATISFPF